VLGGFALLFLVYGAWVDYDVNIVPNPRLPVQAKKDKRERVDFLTIYVTNRGEDIPDLSLKSIGIVVEFAFRDGRREKKTVFPKAEHHGEGAMLSGETGKYEMAVPSSGLKEVTLRSEIVDLGMGRTLVPPGGRR
jgi:archaellum component FlaG (FlaF/FlaG flagellin family)